MINSSLPQSQNHDSIVPLQSYQLSAAQIKEFLDESEDQIQEKDNFIDSLSDQNAIDKIMLKQTFLQENSLFDPIQYFGGLQVADLRNKIQDSRLSDMFKGPFPSSKKNEVQEKVTTEGKFKEKWSHQPTLLSKQLPNNLSSCYLQTPSLQNMPLNTFENGGGEKENFKSKLQGPFNNQQCKQSMISSSASQKNYNTPSFKSQKKNSCQLITTPLDISKVNDKGDHQTHISKISPKTKCEQMKAISPQNSKLLPSYNLNLVNSNQYSTNSHQQNEKSNEGKLMHLNSNNTQTQFQFSQNIKVEKNISKVNLQQSLRIENVPQPAGEQIFQNELNFEEISMSDIQRESNIETAHIFGSQNGAFESSNSSLNSQDFSNKNQCSKQREPILFQIAPYSHETQGIYSSNSIQGKKIFNSTTNYSQINSNATTKSNNTLENYNTCNSVRSKGCQKIQDEQNYYFQQQIPFQYYPPHSLISQNQMNNPSNLTQSPSKFLLFDKNCGTSQQKQQQQQLDISFQRRQNSFAESTGSETLMIAQSLKDDYTVNQQMENNQLFQVENSYEQYISMKEPLNSSSIMHGHHINTSMKQNDIIQKNEQTNYHLQIFSTQQQQSLFESDKQNQLKINVFDQQQQQIQSYQSISLSQKQVCLPGTTFRKVDNCKTSSSQQQKNIRIPFEPQSQSYQNSPRTIIQSINQPSSLRQSKVQASDKIQDNISPSRAKMFEQKAFSELFFKEKEKLELSKDEQLVNYEEEEEEELIFQQEGNYLQDQLLESQATFCERGQQRFAIQNGEQRQYNSYSNKYEDIQTHDTQPQNLRDNQNIEISNKSNLYFNLPLDANFHLPTKNLSFQINCSKDASKREFSKFLSPLFVSNKNSSKQESTIHKKKKEETNMISFNCNFRQKKIHPSQTNQNNENTHSRSVKPAQQRKKTSSVHIFQNNYLNNKDQSAVMSPPNSNQCSPRSQCTSYQLESKCKQDNKMFQAALQQQLSSTPRACYLKRPKGKSTQYDYKQLFSKKPCSLASSPSHHQAKAILSETTKQNQPYTKLEYSDSCNTSKIIPQSNKPNFIATHNYPQMSATFQSAKKIKQIIPSFVIPANNHENDYKMQSMPDPRKQILKVNIKYENLLSSLTQSQLKSGDNLKKLLS